MRSSAWLLHTEPLDRVSHPHINPTLANTNETPRERLSLQRIYTHKRRNRKRKSKENKWTQKLKLVFFTLASVIASIVCMKQSLERVLVDVSALYILKPMPPKYIIFYIFLRVHSPNYSLYACENDDQNG